jgi:hypothetical protein
LRDVGYEIDHCRCHSHSEGNGAASCPDQPALDPAPHAERPGHEMDAMVSADCEGVSAHECVLKQESGPTARPPSRRTFAHRIIGSRPREPSELTALKGDVRRSAHPGATLGLAPHLGRERRQSGTPGTETATEFRRSRFGREPRVAVFVGGADAACLEDVDRRPWRSDDAAT